MNDQSTNANNTTTQEYNYKPPVALALGTLILGLAFLIPIFLPAISLQPNSLVIKSIGALAAISIGLLLINKFVTKKFRLVFMIAFSLFGIYSISSSLLG